MMSRFIGRHGISFCLLLVGFHLSAQTAPSKRNAVFVEMGGVAPHYTVNYAQAILNGEKIDGYLQIGGGIWRNTLAVPIGLSLVLAEGPHHPVFTIALSSYSQGLRFWDRDASDLLLDIVLGVAYRYETEGTPFFIGGGLFPFVHLDPTENAISEVQAGLDLRLGIQVGWYFH